MKNKLILLLLVISVSVAFSCNSTTTPAQAQSVVLQEGIITTNVSAAEFQKLIKSKSTAIILDVRTANEVAQGFIKDAEHIDFYDENFETELNKLDKKNPVLIYCRSGRRSGIAMSAMRNLGFSEVYNLQGGIKEWSEAGLKLEK